MLKKKDNESWPLSPIGGGFGDMISLWRWLGIMG